MDGLKLNPISVQPAVAVHAVNDTVGNACMVANHEQTVSLKVWVARQADTVLTRRGMAGCRTPLLQVARNGGVVAARADSLHDGDEVVCGDACIKAVDGDDVFVFGLDLLGGTDGCANEGLPVVFLKP